MEIDRKTREAYMTWGEFRDLLEYSSTVPSGQTPGKRWKMKRGGEWYLRQYELYPEGHADRENHILIQTYAICIVRGPPTDCAVSAPAVS